MATYSIDMRFNYLHTDLCWSLLQSFPGHFPRSRLSHSELEHQPYLAGPFIQQTIYSCPSAVMMLLVIYFELELI